MRLARMLPLIAAWPLCTACERLPPTETAPMPVSISLNTPDPSFRLDAAERANIGEMYDPDALERLLALVQPDKRAEILAHFQIQPADGQRRGFLVELLDPRLQPLLDAVWAPLWRNATDEEIDANIYGLPGRAAAKRQRGTADGRRRDTGADPR